MGPSGSVVPVSFTNRRTQRSLPGVQRVALQPGRHRPAILGADLLGLNFWPRSVRYLERAAAREIAAAARGRATLVGVFVNEKPAEVAAIARIKMTIACPSIC